MFKILKRPITSFRTHGDILKLLVMFIYYIYSCIKYEKTPIILVLHMTNFKYIFGHLRKV